MSSSESLSAPRNLNSRDLGEPPTTDRRTAYLLHIYSGSSSLSKNLRSPPRHAPHTPHSPPHLLAGWIIATYIHNKNKRDQNTEYRQKALIQYIHATLPSTHSTPPLLHICTTTDSYSHNTTTQVTHTTNNNS
jgi:hypothetical protein